MISYKNIIIHLLSIKILLLFFITPSSPAKYPQGEILKSASELDYPPFCIVRPDGSAEGFSAELLKAAAGKVGLQVDIPTGAWHEIKQKLIEGKLDVLPLVSYSPDRDKVLDFTVPYLRMHETILVRKGETAIRTWADLKGKEVLVMKGDTAHEYAIRENVSDKLILTDTFSEAMRLLATGKHDAVIIQNLVGLQLIKQLEITNVVSVQGYRETSLKPDSRPLTGFEQKFCFAVQEGNQELLAKLNEGLAIVFADGTYNELYEKWFGPILPKPPMPFAEIVKYILLTLAPIVFFLALGGVWYLNRKVRERTRGLNEEKTRAQQSEERFNYAMQATQDGLWDWDVNSDKVYYSPAWIKIIGEDIVPPVYESWEQRIHPDDKEKTLSSLKDHLDGKTACWQYEHRLSTRADGWKWVLGRGQVVTRNSDGAPLRMVGTMQDITERKQVEASLQKRTHDLNERVRELNCLYGISTLRETKNITLDEILQGFVNIIPPAWQYPENTCSRLILGDRKYLTSGFSQTPWKQTAAIMVNGESRGVLEVYFLEEKPENEEEPFLKEERSLINVVAERCGEIIQGIEAEQKVRLLSGLLPICSHCKKIRDDQGYWNQMEVYIRDHSEAEFSHSLCPDCIKKLYPEEAKAWEQEKTKKAAEKQCVG